MEQVREFAELVYNTLGPGLSESAYCKALAVCYHELGICCQSEVTLPIVFKNVQISTLRCDLLVNHIAIEIKTVGSLTATHRQQIRSYLRHMPCEKGILINFGPQSVEVEVFESGFSKFPLS